jgi:hypothetical protein
MSKNKILDVLAAAALRATGGSVPKAIRLLSEPFAMPRMKRTSGESSADAIIDHYEGLLNALEDDGVFGNVSREELTELWRNALVRGRVDDESADGETVPAELADAPHLVLLYKLLKAKVSIGEEDVQLMKAQLPYIDSAPSPPATKKARRSRGGNYVVIPIHDAKAAKRPRPAHRELILYILMKYGEKPYNSTSTKDVIYEVLRGLPGLTGNKGKLYVNIAKAGAKLFITWVSNFLADNLLKQYLGIQGRPIIKMQDPELVRYQDAIDAKMRKLDVNENDNWLEATKLSDEDIRFYDKHFESTQARADVQTALESTQVTGEHGLIYDYFNWATYPLGENDPLSLPPTQSAPDWFNFYRPERNDVPFKEEGTKTSKSSAEPKNKRVSSSSSSGTSPKVAVNRGDSSVSRRDASPVQQQERPIEDLQERLSLVIQRKQKASKKEDFKMAAYWKEEEKQLQAQIDRIIRRQEEVLLRPGDVLRCDFGGIMGDLDFLLSSPPQLALDAQNNGDFHTSQHILFKSVPGSLGDGGSFSPVPLEGEGEGEGINIPSPVEFEGNVYPWASSYFNQ